MTTYIGKTTTIADSSGNIANVDAIGDLSLIHIFSLAAWAMKHLYQYGLGYPKGNTDWGKDAADPRNAIYEGRPDPVRPGYDGNAISRCLAGTGPTSWSLNGKESGVYDLVGNAWEWVDMLIGTTAAPVSYTHLDVYKRQESP